MGKIGACNVIVMQKNVKGTKCGDRRNFTWIFHS